MQLVYLSGAITRGDKNVNWFVAAQAQVALMRAGFAVINPMSSMLMPESVNIDWETWLLMDERIIEACDFLIRIPGDSDGADREVAHALALGIPVHYPQDFPCLSQLFPAADNAA
jgi:hypothetical protein